MSPRTSVPVFHRSVSTAIRILGSLGLASLWVLWQPVSTYAANPTFDHSLPLGTPQNYTNAVAVGDMDGDGDVDVVASNANQSQVYLNDGRGGFAAFLPFSPSSGFGSTTSVVLADLNGDGTLDFIEGVFDGLNRVYLNNGTGQLRHSSSFGFADDSTSAIAVGDINGDEYADIVEANPYWYHETQNRIYLNDGNGNFTVSSAFDYSNDVALGDLNSDGYLDIVASKFGDPSFIYFNDGSGNFPSRTNFVAFTLINSLALADVDRDGHLDIAVAGEEFNHIYFNDGTGRFTLGAPFGEEFQRMWSIAPTDMNGDGHIDLVVGNIERDGQVFYNDGAGNFPTFVSFDTPGAEPRGTVIVADLNRDEAPDIVEQIYDTGGVELDYVSLQLHFSDGSPIFNDGFEQGNLGGWSSKITDSGDLAVKAAAASAGRYGMRALVDNNWSISVTDEKPANETRYRARFYFDPNGTRMAAGDSHVLFYGFSGSGVTQPIVRVQLRFASSAYQVQAGLLMDGGIWRNSHWLTINDEVHSLELAWQAASAAGANNGTLRFWLDGVRRVSWTGVDNDTRRIERIRLGALAGIDEGTRGTYYFDAFASSRLSYIGPTANAVTIAIASTLAIDPAEQSAFTETSESDPAEVALLQELHEQDAREQNPEQEPNYRLFLPALSQFR